MERADDMCRGRCHAVHVCMPRMEITRVNFVVHSFDADAFGYLTPAALAGYLQEAAGISADSLGFGLAALNQKGLTWVLARERVELDQPVRWGETLEVMTWPSGLDRVAALRDFRLMRNGTEIGRAITTWFALDLESRRPVRPTRILPEHLLPQPEHVMSTAAPSVPTPAAVDVERRFQVRYSDIDANLHVTNASYVAWALEAVEEARWRRHWMSGMDIQFLAECRMGGHVFSRSGVDGEDARLHVMVREDDGKEVARARTVWRARG